MAEPVSAIVTALVALFSAYTTYKVGMAQAQQQDEPEPEKTEEATQGEQALVQVKDALQKHGGAFEQDVLAMFEKYPERQGESLKQALTDLAEQDDEFATALRNAAQQVGIVDQQGHVQIIVGQGQGINTMTGGTINNTFN
jgi:hypothetical protein